jgi:hypothetical protein
MADLAMSERANVVSAMPMRFIAKRIDELFFRVVGLDPQIILLIQLALKKASTDTVN